MLSHITTLLWNTRRTGVLLILQILLAFIVLFAIFSYATSAFTDYSERLGFRVEDTYLIVPPVHRLDSTAVVPELMERTRREVEQLPEIKSASLVGFVTPFGDMNMGYGDDESGAFVFTRIFMADEHLAEVMDIAMARGRWYTPEDTIGGRNVIVVNEAFVESNFPGGNLVDTTFLMFGKETTIVGVAKNFKYRREFESEEALIIRFDNPYDGSGNYPYSSLLAHTHPNPTAALEEDVFKRVTEVISTKGTTVTALEPIRERTSRSSLVLLIALLSICAFLVANVALGLFGILINAIASAAGRSACARPWARRASTSPRSSRWRWC